jgi:hypothetical protein
MREVDFVGARLGKAEFRGRDHQIMAICDVAKF